MGQYVIASKDRAVLKDRLPLEKPLSLFMEPTNMCNFRCGMCVHGMDNTRNDLKPFAHMDMELYKRVMSGLREWKGPKIKLLRLAILGEPLLNQHLPDMIKIAKESGAFERIDTFSNGSLLTREMAERVVDSGLDYIRFSIYSVLGDKHRRVTAQDTYTPAKIRENIAYLRRVRESKNSSAPYIFVKMFDTYGPENDKFIAMYGDIADEVDFERVHNATHYSGNDLVRAYYDNEDDAQRTLEGFNKSLNDHMACPKPFMSLFVDSLGNVLMCAHDAPRYTKIANLNETSIKDVWYGEALFEFRKMHIEGRKSENKICRDCDWYKLFPSEDNVDGVPAEKFHPSYLRERFPG